MKRTIAGLAITIAGIIGLSGTAHAGTSPSTVNARAVQHGVFGKGTSFPAKPGGNEVFGDGTLFPVAEHRVTKDPFGDGIVAAVHTR